MDKIHLGAYCIIRKDNSVLVIKKARGPYAGLFDLPGGKIEFGENIEECLKRELYEEVGIDLIKAEFFKVGEYSCEYKDNEGKLKKFHHIGLYYLANVSDGTIKNGSDGQDSNGALYVDINDISAYNFSPIAYSVISQLPRKK